MILRCYGTHTTSKYLYPSDYFDQAYKISFDVGWSMPLSLMRPIYVHYLRSNRMSCRKKSRNIFHFIHFQNVCTHVWGNFQICYHSVVQMVTHRIRVVWSKRIIVINFLKWNDENIRFALNFIHKASIYCGEQMKKFRTQMWTLLRRAQMNRRHYNAWQLRYHLPAIQQTLLKQ